LFGPLEGKALLDIGCGRGRLSRALAKRGAVMTGVDPQDAVLDLAREIAPDSTFQQSGAEALPFDDAHFDGAIILNSLHHVPEAVIDAALAEAMRVVKPGGAFLILEPLAKGGYQAVFAPIDDETEVRAMALRKLEAFIEQRGVEVALRAEYETMIPEENAESVLSGGLRVDPSRAALIDEKRAEVTRLFAEHVCQTDRGPALDQPMIAIALRRT
jgi:ubiquinone/menaquinone biosynthesis C-methylase UbiE